MSDDAARLDSLQVGRDILLQAPAGSGKTTVLAQRFLSALAQVDEPEQVLAITFTRKAAAEMRERVLLALEQGLPATQGDLARWQQLSGAVREHARLRGWQLTELPTRLRIQTIDSLAHEVARAMPLLGRMYASLNVVDDAATLHDEAARETLRHAESDSSFRDDANRLLQRLDNNWDRAAQLLAGLLPWRNRWQAVLLANRPEELGGQVAASLARIAQETLEQAHRVLPQALILEAAALASASAQHRRDAGHDPGGSWSAWLNPAASLAAAPDNLAAWKAAADLALKHDGAPRQQVNKLQGFPADDKSLKTRWQGWLAQLQRLDGALQILRAVNALPPVRIDAEETGALASLARLMMLAGMQLKLVFRERGLVDHAEVAAVARQALRDMQGPTEQSIRETLRVRHLLVDEFQDTSPEQLDLVQELICGWDPGEGRSLFLVGDPMQSIYLFRNSEVGLFLRARDEGVGAIRLETRQLCRNFRARAPLVEWANTTFRAVFPSLESLRSSAVTFLPSEAARPTSDTAEVTIWPQPHDDAQVEAAAIAQEIGRLRDGQPAVSVAVLVQTRALAAPVLRALQAAGIVTQGVDLAMLADRSVVRDLVALGQALLDAGDRTAWLSVLRAPFCGLLLADLKRLCDAAARQPLVDVITDDSVVALLSADARLRLQRTGPILQRAWRKRGARDVASLIEDLWHDLGGHEACVDPGEKAVAAQYLLALRRMQDQSGRPDGEALQQLAGRLRDRGGAGGSNPVEVLTIHHAKGLEWDVVFVPGLGRAARADAAPLLRWLQLPAGAGASDLLLAVHSIGRPDSANALSRYIAGLQAERQQNERLRLLYVAATRARQRLYLSGHAPWRQGAAAAVPARRSLLQLLWPVLHGHFGSHSAPAPTDAPIASSPLECPWLRLPAGFPGPARLPAPVTMPLTRSTVDAASVPEFSWAGPLARAAGTVMHEEFERLAWLGPAGETQVESRLEAGAARLREQGIGAQQAGHTAAAIMRQLRVLAEDPRVRWLLGANHREACSELRLSGIVDGELRHVVIDRSFVDADGTRWVVDYKTSVHQGSGLEQFLQRELQRYAPQLRLYVAIARQLGPQPVRAALYFPWLREFREAPVI